VQLLMWIVVGIVAGLAFLVLVPVLVLGTWFVVMTMTVGLADGAIWLLDRRWRRDTQPRQSTRRERGASRTARLWTARAGIYSGLTAPPIGPL
jgi:hypothetical protein